ncbi:MAG TPA: hypothetical protein VF855_06660, partial [Acidimicrobiales bacterium]
MLRRGRLGVAAILVALVALGLPVVPYVPRAHAAQACTKTWNRGPGRFGNAVWNTDANWTPSGVPTGTDVVCITEGDVRFFSTSGTAAAVEVTVGARLILESSTLNLTSTSDIGGLFLDGGTVNAAVDVTVPTGREAGSLDGSGGTLASTTGARLLVSPGATFSRRGVNQVALNLDVENRGTFEVGTIGLGGSSGILIGQGRRFANSGTFRLLGGAQVATPGAAGSVTFDNSGTVDVIGNSFTPGQVPATVNRGFAVGMTFNNTGTVHIHSGQLVVRAGGTHTGEWIVGDASTNSCADAPGDVVPGAELAIEPLANIVTNFDAGSISGPGCFHWRSVGTIDASVTLDIGALHVLGGTLTMPGDRDLPAVRFAQAGSLSIAGSNTTKSTFGPMSGGSGTITGGGSLRILPEGRFEMKGNNGFSLTGNVTVTVDGALLHPDSSQVSITGSADLVLNGISNTGAIRLSSADSTGTFTNNGTMTVAAGTGTASVSGLAVSNPGKIRVDSGIFSFNPRSNAQIATALNRRRLTGGTWEVASGASFRGLPLLHSIAGRLVLEGSATAFQPLSTNPSLIDIDTIEASGELALRDGAVLDVSAGASNGFTNNGRLEMTGASVLTTLGAYGQTGTLAVEAGARSGLVEAGTATLGGTLELSRAPGHADPITNRLVVDAVVVRTGEFAKATTSDGGTASTTYTSTDALFDYAPSAVDPLVVTTAADSGVGSLRGALLEANARPGANTISFDIPGGGPHRIAPTSPLPDVTDLITIDGTTQTGYLPGAGKQFDIPAVEIDGSSLHSSGLVVSGIDAIGSRIKGLSITGWKVNGITTLVGGLVVDRTWIGMTPDGAVKGNATGISGIGGDSQVFANVISGNTRDGINWFTGVDVEICDNEIGGAPDQ